MRHALIGAALVVLLFSDSPPQLRDMESGEQRQVELDRIVAEVTGGAP